MRLDDFIANFELINICRLQQWDEIRIKGQFTRTEPRESSGYARDVISKNVFEITLKQRQKVFFGIHLKDIRIGSCKKRFPYFAAGFALLRRKKDGGLSLIGLQEYEMDRQSQLEIDLEAGEYFFLPRASGCCLQKPPTAHYDKDATTLVDTTGQLNGLTRASISSIFKRLDSIKCD